MKKVVKFFLSSTLQAMPEDRESIAAFINMMNNRLGRHNIFFTQVYCDYEETPLGEMPAKAVIEQAIEECAAAFFIINLELDDMTEAEFESAYEKFKELNHPRIIVTFKKNAASSLSSRAQRFENRISSELNHYYDAYEHFDQLKLRLLIELTLNMPEFTLDIKDGSCYVNKEEITEIRNAPFYKNHRHLNRLKDELKECEDAFFILGTSQEERLRALQISMRMNELEQEISDLETNLMSMLRRAYDEAGKNTLTPLLKRAMVFIEEGDIDKASEILSNEAILKQSRATKAKGKNLKDEMEAEVATMLVAADTRLQTDRPERFREVEELYEQAVADEVEFNLDRQAHPDYADYLDHQNQFSRAIEIVESYDLYLESRPEPEDTLLASTAIELGRLYSYIQRHDKADECFLRANSIMQGLSSEEYPDFWERLSDSLYATKKYDAAIASNLVSIRCFEEKIAEDGMDLHYGYRLADSYFKGAWISYFRKNYETAEEYLGKIIELVANLSEKNLEKEQALVKCYSSLGSIYLDTKRMDEAGEMYRKAVEIYERLVIQNPAAYEPYLASELSKKPVFIWKLSGTMKQKI